MILLTGLGVFGDFDGNNFFKNFNINIGTNYSYADADSYQTGSAAVGKNGITAIEIDWVAGDVNITSTTGDNIMFSETSSRNIDSDLELRYRVANGKLTIKFCKSGGLKLFSTAEKTLNIQIPVNLLLSSFALDNLTVSASSANLEVTRIPAAVFDLHSVSGRVTLSDSTCTKAEVSTTSGGIRVENLTADLLDVHSTSGSVNIGLTNAAKLDISTVSGSITAEGRFETVDSTTTSGSTRIDSTVCPGKLSISSISGSIRLALPDNDGFFASYSTVSGSFKCAFPVVSSGRTATYKSGGAIFDFSTVSGSIKIEVR